MLCCNISSRFYFEATNTIWSRFLNEAIWVKSIKKNTYLKCLWEINECGFSIWCVKSNFSSDKISLILPSAIIFPLSINTHLLHTSNKNSKSWLDISKILSIYIEVQKTSVKFEDYLLTIGVSSIDITPGQNLVSEI